MTKPKEPNNHRVDPEAFAGGSQEADYTSNTEQDDQSPESAADQSALRKEFHDLEVALKDAKSEVLYHMAECKNIRERASRDVENAHRYGTEKLLSELLPVLDSFERGMDACDDTEDKIKALHEGMSLTYTMFLKALEKYGVEQVDPEGREFDANLHEALSVKEDKAHKTNTVLEVMQKGYLLNGRIVRRALVVVAK